MTIFNLDLNGFSMSWSIKTITFLMFSVFAIASIGYLLGRITIKGVNLGTGGVFIIALLYGILFYDQLAAQFTVTTLTGTTTYVSNVLKAVENLGLILFVTSVGFIAGPKFFSNLKKNFKSYVMIALIIIASGTLAAIGCILVGRLSTDPEKYAELTAMIAGLLAGALTSTPAFSAAKESAGDYETAVSTGYGIAYIFGVIGVVLFIQLMPKFMKANMDLERSKITSVEEGSAAKESKTATKESKTATKELKIATKALIEMDSFGLMPFSLAAILGMLLGSFKVAGFSLTTTGGCLLVSLIFGHFSRIGRISIMPDVKTLKVFREFGLMLFLIGAGVAGGATFLQMFQPVYFLYGVVLTIVPMIGGFLFAKYVLKLPLLNNLGSITGGMTSTPALGTLINVSGTEDVASAYAATYPFALIAVVVASQLIIRLFS